MIGEDRVIMGNREMMAKGTVKSFNRSRGYGFIQTESGGKEVFVHLSAVQKAGLAALRKGQKVSFEVFDNQGRVAARNLCLDKMTSDVSERKLLAIQNGIAQNAWYEMKTKSTEQLKGKRTLIARAALESTIAEIVRASDPQCEGLIGIIVERVVPTSPGTANWIVKGIKYGKVERARCSAVISKCVEDGQRDFEISD
jgi:CspA family cold shock protein